VRLLEQASDLGAVDRQVSCSASYHYVKLEIVGSNSGLLREAKAVLGAVDRQVSCSASYHYVKLQIVGSNSALL